MPTDLAQRHVPVDPKIKLGSGGRFRKLKSRLAARGARNPGALAAYIGRRAYGKKKFGALGAAGRAAHAHASTPVGLLLDLAAWEHELRGKGGKWADTGGGRGMPNDHPPASQMTVAQLRAHMEGEHGGGPRPPSLRGTSRAARGKAALVTAHEHMHSLLAGGGARGNEVANQGIGHSHGMGPGGSAAAKQYRAQNLIRTANIRRALEFAMASPALAVTSPYDVMIVRAEDGSGAMIRHRRGGGDIGSIKRTDAGWVATRAGKDLGPHTRQRGALLELIGTHNRSAGTPFHRPEAGSPPLQAGPVQTPLMARFGIPAISTLATPTVGASDGPRATGPDLSALGTKGKGIYAKLRKRGFPHERAHNFARRAQNKGRK